MLHRSFKIMMTLALSLYSFQVYAGYTVDSGLHQIITPPPPLAISVSANTPDSTTDWFFFEEKQGVTLTNALPVDGLNPGDGFYNEFSDLTAGSILAGTEVNSYFLLSNHSDTNTYDYSGQITFINEKIIGVQVFKVSIEVAINDQVNLRPLISYNVRTFNLTPGVFHPDTFTLTNSATTIAFTMETGDNGMDNIRILTTPTTTPVPEPKVYLILGSLCGAVLFMRYVKKRKAT